MVRRVRQKSNIKIAYLSGLTLALQSNNGGEFLLEVFGVIGELCPEDP
jgi:hypothetical protein